MSHTKSGIIYGVCIILAISVVAVFLNLYPHLYAFQHTPQGYIFSGQASWFDPWDINVYVSAIRWGQSGGFLMENLYDSQHQTPIFYYPIYTLAGRVFSNSNPFLVFYGLSIPTCVLLIATLYYWLLFVFRSRYQAGWLSLITILGGGFGYLTWNPEKAHLSPDLSMTGFTFTSAIQRPHEAIAMIALISCLFLSFRFICENLSTNKILIYLTSLIALILSLIFYPFYALNIILIWFLFALSKQYHWNHIIWRYGLGLVGTAVLSVFLMNANLTLNSSFGGVTHQSLSNPSIFSFVIGYGPLLFGFVYWLIKYRQASSLTRFLLIWVSVCLFLSLLPLGFARFYFRGLFLPLTALTGQALLVLVQQNGGAIKEALIKLGLICLLLVTSFSNLTIFFLRLREVGQQNPWYYLSSADHQLILQLQKLPNSYQGVMTDYYLSNLIPAFSSKRVFLGHKIQTPDFDQRQRWLTRLFACELKADTVSQYLEELQIQFIVWPKQTSGCPPEFGPISSYPFLNQLYENQFLTLYEIKK